MDAEKTALDRGALLSAALKAIRRRRGLTVLQAARAMGLPKRTYEHFESGKPDLDIERVHKAAKAFNADPYAILTSIEIGSPEFAARCADNQLMAALTFGAQDLDAKLGDDILQLDAATLMFHISRMFAALAEEARRRRELRARFLSPPSPGEEDPSD